MNKTDFTKLIAKKADMTNASADKFINAFEKTVAEVLANGDDVALVGFGSFSVIERAARTARNFKTKAPIPVPASKGIKFKPGKNLKDAVK